MKERKINDNASCFLIKDERLKKDWTLTPIFAFLKEEGFVAQKGIDEMCRDAWNWQKKNPKGFE